MFSKQPLTLVAFSGLLTSVLAEFSSTCTGVQTSVTDNKPILHATCQTMALNGDFPSSTEDTTLDLSEDGHILWDGGPWWPQCQELGYSITIADGHILQMYTSSGITGGHNNEGSWDLDDLIKNDDGTLRWQ